MTHEYRGHQYTIVRLSKWRFYCSGFKALDEPRDAEYVPKTAFTEYRLQHKMQRCIDSAIRDRELRRCPRCRAMPVYPDTFRPDCEHFREASTE